MRELARDVEYEFCGWVYSGDQHHDHTHITQDVYIPALWFGEDAHLQPYRARVMNPDNSHANAAVVRMHGTKIR